MPVMPHLPGIAAQQNIRDKAGYSSVADDVTDRLIAAEFALYRRTRSTDMRVRLFTKITENPTAGADVPVRVKLVFVGEDLRIERTVNAPADDRYHLGVHYDATAVVD
jgi:hypothetical protein